MAFEPLRSEDRRLLLVVLLVVAVCAAYTLYNYEAAFPQASLHLRYSKGEITKLAERFLESQGLSTAGFRNLTLFSPDHSARLFLEHELGLEEANRLMEGEVAVWRWRARWLKPPEEEELIAYLAPDGRLVGFEHVIPEAEPGARLERDQAFTLARDFLRSQTTLPHRLIEEQLQERPNRLDYEFTWEQEGFRAKDATYRRTVIIQGDRVGYYSEHLNVPERWEREYAGLRSSNELYSGIAWALYLLLILAAVAILIQALRRHEIRWRPLLIVCGVAGGVAVLDTWNLLPFHLDSMPTSSPFSELVLLALLQGLGAGVFNFFYVIFGAAPGENLYRRFKPNNLSLGGALSLRGTRTREFFNAAVAGYGFAAFHLAFIVGFYILGKSFGVWSPQDVGYSDVLSTAAPWLYPLGVAVLASTAEESWWRLLAIPLLKRYLRSTWLAVLIPAFIWGFLHANYPQQPGYIRGLEVGFIGVAAGFLMLRYGILATLIWHYTIDALLVSTILFESDSWYLWGSGIVVTGIVLIPAALCFYHYRKNGGFLVDETLLNRAPAATEKEARTTPEPLRRGEAVRPSWRPLWLYTGGAAALAVGLIVNPVTYGDFIKVDLTRWQAEKIARQALTEKGVNPGAWRTATRFISNLEVVNFEYVRRLEGPEAADHIVEERTIHGVWSVRFFRPLVHEEWRVYVNRQGAAYRVDHVLEETARGANLDPENAQRLARQYLENHARVPMEEYRLVDHVSETRENRTDHSFVWEDRDFRIGDATSRISISVIGDEVSGYRRFLKLPEEWLREFNKPRLQHYIIPALGGAIGLPLLIIFVRRIGSREAARSQHYNWRLYLTAGAIGALVSLASGANQWVSLFTSYNTAEPLENHVGQWVLGRLMLILLTGLGAFFLFMVGDVFLQLAVGWRAWPKASLTRTIAVAVLVGGLFRIFAWVEQLVPGDRFSLPLWTLPGSSTTLPAVSVLAQGLFNATVMVVTVSVVGATGYRFLRGRIGAGLLIAVFALSALGQSSTVGQWSLHFLELLVLLGLVVMLVRTCGLDIAAFGIAAFWLQIVKPSLVLAEQPNQFLAGNGYATLAIALLLGLGGLFWLRRIHSPPQQRIFVDSTH